MDGLTAPMNKSTEHECRCGYALDAPSSKGNGLSGTGYESQVIIVCGQDSTGWAEDLLGLLYNSISPSAQSCLLCLPFTCNDL